MTCMMSMGEVKVTGATAATASAPAASTCVVRPSNSAMNCCGVAWRKIRPTDWV